MATTPKKEATEKAAPAAKEVKAPIKQALPKLEDSVRVTARSNQCGKLGFTNTRTHDSVLWNDLDDVQYLSVGDVRDMKANAPRFFTEPWIWIESIETPECAGFTTEQIYETLGLKRYLDKTAAPFNLCDVCNWDEQEIRDTVPNMTRGTRENVAIALNSAILDKRLNNLSVIKVWEEELGCSLLDG